MSRQPHKHSEVIHAFADGYEVEFRRPAEGIWRESNSPTWSEVLEYRVRPGQDDKEEPQQIQLELFDVKRMDS